MGVYSYINAPTHTAYLSKLRRITIVDTLDTGFLLINDILMHCFSHFYTKQIIIARNKYDYSSIIPITVTDVFKIARKLYAKLRKQTSLTFLSTLPCDMDFAIMVINRRHALTYFTAATWSFASTEPILL